MQYQEDYSESKRFKRVTDEFEWLVCVFFVSSKMCH